MTDEDICRQVLRRGDMMLCLCIAKVSMMIYCGPAANASEH